LKLNYTKDEVKKLKEKIYFTQQEEQILEYWNLDYSIVMIASKLNISTSTVTRRKREIRNKIDRIKTP
jgi:DNA-binding NarL/FixJ family response regulator